MRRREFITLLGGAAGAWPLAARAQQRTIPTVGLLSGETPGGLTRFVAAFRAGLGEAGYIEGRNVAIEYRWAEARFDRLPRLASDLLRSQVAVVFAAGTPSALAAKSATTTVPVVFVTAADPVEIGLVASLNRPGGNVTGITQLGVENAPKRLELLHKLVPKATVIALLIDPTDQPLAETQSRGLQAAARTLGLQMPVLEASSDRDFDRVSATLAQLRPGALVIAGANFFNPRIEQLAALAARHTVPATYQYREFAAAGGLMSYGTNRADTYRQAGVYAGRILKGEKPADMPVIQPTKFELVINHPTARMLGLTIPPSLLAVADEVIE
jgi:ABC-type uncharacterized transport system substrate-binding protein